MFFFLLQGRTAPDSGLPSFVAVKQLLSTQDEDQFWVEAKTAASVPSHDNVVSFLGWGEIFGKLSLVFEFCEEKDLHSYMKKNSDPLTKQHTLSPAVIVDLCKQITAGMAFIHESRHFHRDLKPNNILLTRRGAVGPSGLRAVITDLGSAKNIATEINLSQSVLGSQVGTLIYMAPETIAKSVFSQGGCPLHSSPCPPSVLPSSSCLALTLSPSPSLPRQLVCVRRAHSGSCPFPQALMSGRMPPLCGSCWSDKRRTLTSGRTTQSVLPFKSGLVTFHQNNFRGLLLLTRSCRKRSPRTTTNAPRSPTFTRC
jgi:serine/threonine protein kinase